MRCPWRPSCLSECGNSGLPRAQGWECKRNGPCWRPGSCPPSAALTQEEAGELVESPPRGCRGKKLGLWGARLALPLGTILTPPDPRGGTLPAKSPTTATVCCQQGRVRNIAPQWKLLPSLFPSVFCGQSSVESRHPDSF